MGLGKTVMTISVMLAHSWKAASTGFLSPINEGDKVISSSLDESTSPSEKSTKFPGFDKKLLEPKSALENGGNLIVCPMTLLSQWKVLSTFDANTHQFGCLSKLLSDFSCYFYMISQRSKCMRSLGPYLYINITAPTGQRMQNFYPRVMLSSPHMGF